MSKFKVGDKARVQGFSVDYQVVSVNVGVQGTATINLRSPALDNDIMNVPIRYLEKVEPEMKPGQIYRRGERGDRVMFHTFNYNLLDNTRSVVCTNEHGFQVSFLYDAFHSDFRLEHDV